MAPFMQKFYVEHLNTIKQILWYVAGTKDLALKYDKFFLFIISRFLYFDYGGDRDEKKSTSTYFFSISLGPISWDSKNQPTTTLSTIETEYHAISIVA